MDGAKNWWDDKSRCLSLIGLHLTFLFDFRVGWKYCLDYTSRQGNLSYSQGSSILANVTTQVFKERPFFCEFHLPFPLLFVLNSHLWLDPHSPSKFTLKRYLRCRKMVCKYSLHCFKILMSISASFSSSRAAKCAHIEPSHMVQLRTHQGDLPGEAKHEDLLYVVPTDWEDNNGEPSEGESSSGCWEQTEDDDESDEINEVRIGDKEVYWFLELFTRKLNLRLASQLTSVLLPRCLYLWRVQSVIHLTAQVLMQLMLWSL